MPQIMSATANPKVLKLTLPGEGKVRQMIDFQMAVFLAAIIENASAKFICLRKKLPSFGPSHRDILKLSEEKSKRKRRLFCWSFF